MRMTVAHGSDTSSSLTALFVLIGRLLIEMPFLLGSIMVNCLDSLAFSFRALASCGLAAVSSFAVSTVIVLWAAYFF